MPENRETCFVIMPFSQTTEKHTEEYWNEHFKNFLKPLVEENSNLEARRSEALRGDILQQIITNLAIARIVVADLSDHNCNVYWELGIRQSYKHGTVTIAEFDTNLPFDISSKGTLWYYPNNHLKMQDFRERFKQALTDCLVNPDFPDSHVLETLGGRGTLFEIFRKDEAIRRLDALIAECNYNLWLLGRIAERAKQNIELRKSKSESSKTLKGKAHTLAEYLGSSALDLLIVERYVQEDEGFYGSLRDVRTWIEWVNHQIRNWRTSMESGDKLLISGEKDANTQIGTALSLANKARTKVSKLL